MEIKRQRIDEVYIIRTLAIIGVLMVHATSSAVGQVSAQSSLYYAYNFANIFFKFGTPTFIFLSSLVLFYNYYHRPFKFAVIGNFFKKRLLYILLPYLLISLMYHVILHFEFYSERTLGEATIKFLDKLWTGKAYAHLYFVFISVQFYLLFPFLLLLFQKVKWLAKYSIPIGFGLQWAFVLLNNKYFGITMKGNLSISYFSYYFLGAFVGIYYEQVKDWLIIKKENMLTRKGLFWLVLWSAWLAFGLGHVYIYYVTRGFGASFDSRWYEMLWNFHTYTAALVLFQLGFIIYAKVTPIVVNAMIHLGMVSFGVYLIHPLFLFYYRKTFVSGEPAIYHAWVAGGFIVALGLSWLVVGLMRYVKGSWVIFGTFPSTHPYVNRIKHKKGPSSSSQRHQTAIKEGS